MPAPAYDCVICGAGLAGISTAYQLAARFGLRDVLMVDERAPLSLTSDKSTECYRNWWPGPDDAMVRLVNRSIDLLEELARTSGNVFHLNRRGYLYVTADPGRVGEIRREAQAVSALGAGPLREHPGAGGYQPAPASDFQDRPAGADRIGADGIGADPIGADLIVDPALIHELFPYLTEQAAAVLHVRRAGWLSAQQLGMYLLEQARACGVRLQRGRLAAVDLRGGRVAGVRLEGAAGTVRVETAAFVDAGGPLVADVARLMGVELPVFAELHAKVSFADRLGAVPREAPLLIWTDPQRLPWSEEERRLWAESAETRWLLEELPGGAHTRPEGPAGSETVLMLWPYHTPVMHPQWPPAFDPSYAEVTLRGLATMLPGLRAYLSRMPKPVVDGGYYLKTAENRPLIGPLPVAGAYMAGALSGFGLMAACGAGELAAAHVAGASLPDYAPAFRLERYDDPAYRAAWERWQPAGQL